MVAVLMSMLLMLASIPFILVLLLANGIACLVEQYTITK